MGTHPCAPAVGLALTFGRSHLRTTAWRGRTSPYRKNLDQRSDVSRPKLFGELRCYGEKEDRVKFEPTPTKAPWLLGAMPTTLTDIDAVKFATSIEVLYVEPGRHTVGSPP